VAGDVTPTEVSGASFKTVRKGYDPDDVDSFLDRAAKALEDAQQQAAAMEARARAAVARLQEMTVAQDSTAADASHAPAAGDGAPAPDPATYADSAVQFAPDEAETISRTLLLAQRTADTTIADARAEAERIVTEARREAETTLDSTREMSAKLLDDARSEARRNSESERIAAENEVQSLVARREFLLGDVDQLEQFLVEQRDRLRAAAHQIEAMVERVPAGLGQVRPPVMSAADEPPGDDTAEQFRPPGADLVDDDGDETELSFADASADDSSWDDGAEHLS
jgi:DivIVA domain-containing protein